MKLLELNANIQLHISSIQIPNIYLVIEIIYMLI